MKVSDDMVEAAMREMFGRQKVYYGAQIAIRRALEEAMKVYAMEQLIEAGAEQMEQEGDNG